MNLFVSKIVFIGALALSFNVYGQGSNLAPSPNLNISSLDMFDISPIQINGVFSTEDSKKVKISELYKGKWVILDLSATWCPYCKMDQYVFSGHRNKINEYTTAGKLWTQDVVQVHLMIEYKKEGGFKQTKEIISDFLSPQKLSRDDYLKDLDRSNIDTLFVNTESAKAFTQSLDKTGNPIFEGFKGFPYQLVFNPKGELVFRGQFTEATEADGERWELPYLRHYERLTSLIESK